MSASHAVAQLAAGSTAMSKSCGPSSVITLHVDEVLQLGERLLLGGLRVAGARVAVSRSWSSIYAFLPKSFRFDPAAGCAVDSAPAPGGDARCRSLRAAETPRRPPTAGRAVTIGMPSLTARGISRSLGTKHVGRRAEHGVDVALADADAAVRAVEHEADPVAVVLHQLERLEPELRVLERERVEHPDHDEVGRVVDRRDHLGGEARGRVDDDEVVVRAQRSRRSRGGARR